ncbi:MAG: putative two-component hybrid sensor and regulator [Chloroflexi bacterium OLB13]|nr:MAG: putative two-component hybrid sensor and regulator [Chloroflexi bacterium OLB13]
MGEITLHLPDQLIERAQQAGLLNTETIAEVLSLALGDEASGVPPLPIRSIRSFFDQIHDAVFLLDLNGRHFAANERAVDMFGYTVEEIYTKSALELSGEPEATDNVMGRLLAGEHVPMLKRWMRHKSGALFPVEVTAQLVRDSEGKPAYIQSIVRDITEHIQSEQRIRDAESLLRTIINAVPNHIFARDGEGRYVIANEAAAQIVGSTVDEIIGKTDFDLGVPAAAQIRAEDADVLRVGEPRTILEDEFIDPRGERHLYSTTKVPIKLPGTNIDAVLCVSTDISPLKQMQADLHEAVRQAYALETERQRVTILAKFIQDTSHEFRTPLSIIGTSVYLLRRSSDEARRDDHARVANDQINRITRLLDHLQAMAELDAGVDFHRQAVNINHLLRDLRSHFAALCERREIRFDCAFDNTIPTIIGDPVRLSEACSQLIDNALRHTDSGGSVVITTARNHDGISIEVRDTGVGIHPDALPHIFDRFWRQDEARTTPGFGLGLPIAQRIIERHGGKITVDSRVDAGSVFTVHLPSVSPE